MNVEIFNNIMELIEKLDLDLSYLPLKGKDYIEALYIFNKNSDKRNFANVFFYENRETILSFFTEEYTKELKENKGYVYSPLVNIKNPSYIELLIKFNFYL